MHSLAPNILHKNCLQFLLAHLSNAGELETRCVISNESVANKTLWQQKLKQQFSSTLYTTYKRKKVHSSAIPCMIGVYPD